MAFNLRTMTARRYRIEGDVPAAADPAFAARLLARRFRPLSPHEERGYGWVSADNFLDADLTTETVARGPCAVFALRIDRRRVDNRLLKARLDLEFRGRAKDAEAGSEGRAPPRRRPGREERQEMRRALVEEMLAATPPKSDVFPVLVWPKDRLLLFRSLSRPANEVFRAVFLDTFGAALATLTPYHRGLELLRERGGSSALGALSKTEYGRVPGGAADVPAWRRAIATEAPDPSETGEVTK